MNKLIEAGAATLTGAEAVIEMLKAHGVEVIFGLCGDTKIKAGQNTGYGGRYFSVDFGVTDHAKVAEAFGVKSWKVEDPALLGGVAPVSEWVA